MTHGLSIKPHERDCICPPPWSEKGHSPACQAKHRRDFFALVAETRAKAEGTP